MSKRFINSVCMNGWEFNRPSIERTGIRWGDWRALRRQAKVELRVAGACVEARIISFETRKWDAFNPEVHMRMYCRALGGFIEFHGIHEHREFVL